MARFVASDGPGCSEVVVSCMQEAAETMAGFYYSAQYEAEAQAAPAETAEARKRTADIEEMLRVPVPRVALLNRFVPLEVQNRTVDSQHLKERPEFTINGVYALSSKSGKGEISAFREAASISEEDEGGNMPRIPTALKLSPDPESSKLPCCFMTGAQVLAVQALCVKQGEKVLDLCAGPGAKALLLASALFGPESGKEVSPTLLEAVGSEAGVLASRAGSGGRLVLNEPNKARANVLEALLEAFLPAELLGKGGGVVLAKAQIEDKVPLALARLGPYDKILVDAPCTAARAKALNQNYQYSSATVKQNAEIQALLLRSAGALLKPGGLIVYATSSVEEKENDEVVKHFLRRVGDDFETVNDEDDAPKAKGATPTMHGVGYFPGAGTHHGPLYVSRISKINPDDYEDDAH